MVIERFINFVGETTRERKRNVVIIKKKKRTAVTSSHGKTWCILDSCASLTFKTILKNARRLGITCTCEAQPSFN